MTRLLGILLFLAFSLTSCNKGPSMTEGSDPVATSPPGIFKGVENWHIELDYIEGVDYSITAEVALKIGDAVLEHVFGNKILDTVFSVSEISGKNYYVVSRLPNNLIPGEDYNVAIDKTDGSILKVWVGE